MRKFVTFTRTTLAVVAGCSLLALLLTVGTVALLAGGPDVDPWAESEGSKFAPIIGTRSAKIQSARDTGGEDPPGSPLTFQEELEAALPMIQAELKTRQVRGVWLGPGLDWTIEQWEPTNATKKRSEQNLVWPVIPTGACDTQAECTDELADACSDAGHGGVDADTVKIIRHLNGTSTCSGDCTKHGAVAFVICGNVT